MLNFRFRPLELIFRLRYFLTTTRKIQSIIPTVTIFSFWRIISEYREVSNFEPTSGPSFGMAALTTVFTFACCYTGSLLILKTKKRLWLPKYLLVMGLSVAPISIYLYLNGDESFDTAFIQFLRLVFLVVVSESIVAYLIFTIQTRNYELERHQDSLLVAEEKFRNSVSSFLHDNLQARLVAVGIQLSQIRAGVNQQSASELNSVISEIERIRSSDVRDFSRRITPLSELDGLDASLQRLFDGYKNVLDCHCADFSALTVRNEDQERFDLGIYRITEQAMLNSLKHGGATRFEIKAFSDENSSTLQILNNGQKYERHSAVQGHGFAVIDAWVGNLGGTWQINNRAGQVEIEIRWEL
jgi:signal transduction histidine kinase